MLTLTLALLAFAPDVPKQPLEDALRAVEKARRRGRGKKQLLTLIDYSKRSSTRRLWVLDLKKRRVLFRELVAHGKGSDRGGEAVRFSNEPGSLASSLGLYETLGTYQGKHGYSLELRGLDRGINDNAESRAIVIHAAWYVSPAFAKKHGRLGRSWGCPALDERIASKIIDRIKGGSLLYIHGK